MWIKKGSLNGELEIVKVWVNIEHDASMHLKAWNNKGLGEWKLSRCPWWLDYPLGSIPITEEHLWEGELFSSWF